MKLTGKINSCGVYKITCLANGKTYIGSSSSVENRLKCHFRSLKDKKHHCKPLQRDYDRYGDQMFSTDFSVVPRDQLRALEKREIEIFQQKSMSYNLGKIVNTRTGYGRRGGKSVSTKTICFTTDAETLEVLRVELYNRKISLANFMRSALTERAKRIGIKLPSLTE